MTPSDHQLERMRHWSRSYAAATAHACNPAWQGARDDFADEALAEFDKRFPAPVEPVAEADRERRENLHCVISDLTDQCREANAELATLRQKARLWDALSGGVIVPRQLPDATWSVSFYLVPGGKRQFRYCATFAEAVQAAIDAGALK